MSVVFVLGKGPSRRASPREGKRHFLREVFSRWVRWGFLILQSTEGTAIRIFAFWVLGLQFATSRGGSGDKEGLLTARVARVFNRVLQEYSASLDMHFFFSVREGDTGEEISDRFEFPDHRLARRHVCLVSGDSAQHPPLHERSVRLSWKEKQSSSVVFL